MSVHREDLEKRFHENCKKKQKAKDDLQEATAQVKDRLQELIQGVLSGFKH